MEIKEGPFCTRFIHINNGVCRTVDDVAKVDCVATYYDFTRSQYFPVFISNTGYLRYAVKWECIQGQLIVYKEGGVVGNAIRARKKEDMGIKC